MSSRARLSSTWSRAARVPATGVSFAWFGLGVYRWGVLLFRLISLLVWAAAGSVSWWRAERPRHRLNSRGDPGMLDVAGIVLARTRIFI